jgi:hypothetical protein
MPEARTNNKKIGTSETEFTATSHMGPTCHEALVQQEKSGDFSTQCEVDLDTDYSYSYSYSYGEVDGYTRWACPQLEPSDWIQLDIYMPGTCGDDDAWFGSQLWSKECFQPNAGVSMAYICDAVEGFGVAMWLGASCSGEPFMTLEGAMWPFAGEPGTCLDFGAMPFMVSCSCTACGNVVDAAPTTTVSAAAAVTAAGAAALLL